MFKSQIKYIDWTIFIKPKSQLTEQFREIILFVKRKRKNTTAFIQLRKLTDLFSEAATKCTKKDICFCLNLSIKSFRLYVYVCSVPYYMEISGMALEHAHFQFSRIKPPTDRMERASERTNERTARQYTSHEPCGICVHPLANTKIMTIDRQQHGTHHRHTVASLYSYTRQCWTSFFGLILLFCYRFSPAQSNKHTHTLSSQKIVSTKGKSVVV